MDERWKYLKNNLINATKQVCGVSAKHTWKRQTWWWNDKMQQAVSHKRKCFKVWKAGGDRDAYQAAKRTSNLAVHIAKTDVEKIALKQINSRSVEIYRLAKQMRRENQDLIGDKRVRTNNSQMSLDVDSKKEAWREHYMHLLNVEFSWNPGGLSEVYPVKGLSEPMTIAMVGKAINKMSLGKAAGPSGIVAEMLKAAGSSGASMIRDLIEDIIFENRITSEWQKSHIVSVYKGKGDALNRSNYRGLKLIDQVMKVLERVVEGFIRQRVVINDMQCGFMQGRGTNDAIFILHHSQEKHLVAGKPLYLAFIDLEKAFNRVPREVIWWGMGKLKIDEWLVRIVQSMYKEVRSRVRVGDEYSNSFDVRVGAHQGSVLSPLFFFIVLEALSMEFRTGCPWEILYADDLMVSAPMEIEDGEKGLRVNMGKTKLMVSGSNLDVLRKSGKYPCGVCQAGVGRNDVQCGGSRQLVHKKCSGIKGSLTSDLNFRCAHCLGTARSVDGRLVKEVMIGNEKLEVVPEFCYLGDILSAGGGCELASISRCKCVWAKIQQLLPLLANSHLSLLTRGRVYSTCVRRAMLHAAETWPVTVSTLNRLRQNDLAMIHWMCNIEIKDNVCSHSLLLKIGIRDVKVVLRTSRMRWFGNVERSVCWISQLRKLDLDICKKPGRPKKTWNELILNDKRKLDMVCADPLDRSEWKGRL